MNGRWSCFEVICNRIKRHLSIYIVNEWMKTKRIWECKLIPHVIWGGVSSKNQNVPFDISNKWLIGGLGWIPLRNSRQIIYTLQK